MREAQLYPITDLNDGSTKLLRVLKGSALENALELTKKVRSVAGIPPNVKLTIRVGDDGKITIKQ